MGSAAHCPGDILVFLTGQAEIEKAIVRINNEVAALPGGSCGPLLALPLHASLPPDMQVGCEQCAHFSFHEHEGLVEASIPMRLHVPACLPASDLHVNGCKWGERPFL